MPVVRQNVASAIGKIAFMAEEVTYRTPVWPTSAQALYLNEPPNPAQPLRVVNDRQQRNSFGKRRRLPNRYGVGTTTLRSYIKPSGVLGTRPHAHQLLKGLWGRETATPGVSVLYEPSVPGTPHPAYSILMKYGHRTNLLSGSIVRSGDILGTADESDDVYAQVVGNIEFARRYWVGKDEVNAIAAAAATAVTVKDATKFAYGFSATPAFGMRLQFRHVADNSVDDNAGAGYTIDNVNTTTNVVTLTTGLVDPLAVDDVIEGFVPSGIDVGDVVNFYLGNFYRDDGTLQWIIENFEFHIENGHIIILHNQKDGTPYPSRKLDGMPAGREITANIRYLLTEDETGFDYVSEQQLSQVIKAHWGTTAGNRFLIQLDNVQIDSPSEEGDAEIRSTTLHRALETSGGDEGFMLFD